MTNGTWGTTVRHELIETPWELQDVDPQDIQEAPDTDTSYYGIIAASVLTVIGVTILMVLP